MTTQTNKKKAGAATTRKRRPTNPEFAGLRDLRKRLGVSQETMARLLDVSTRSVSTLESEKGRKSTPPRAVIEMKRLIETLAEVIRVDAIAAWLDEPNDAFNGLKPIEVIERGEVDRIWAMVHFVGSGEPM